MKTKQTPAEQLGAYIKYQREGRHWSQSKLAREIRVSGSMISLYESGRRRPSVTVLANLADALKCKIAVLVGLLRKPPKDE